MYIKGFALQGHEINGREEKAVINYCVLNDVPYKSYSKFEDVPEGYIPVGRIEWCEHFLPVEATVPDYYPEFLKDYLFRRVWRADKWPLGQHVFIKPADKHKRFDGLITDGGYRKKKKPPYWCSGIVKFVNEWRYYVVEGKVLTGEWYDGDQENTPVAPALKIAIPEGYCGALDFGMLNTGEFALVEAHSPYACGWYGDDYKLFVEWIVKGWEYMLRACVNQAASPVHC